MSFHKISCLMHKISCIHVGAKAHKILYENIVWDFVRSRLRYMLYSVQWN